MSKRRSKSSRTTLVRSSARIRWSKAIDNVIGLLKWPVAILMLVVLPFSLIALWRLSTRIWHEPTPVMAFIFGLIGYVALWHLILRHRLLGTFFSTLEHELTHAIFALLTLHPVTGLRATFSKGGHMQYATYGARENWLIAVAPYFFPTVCFAMLLVLAFIPDDHRWIAEWLLGAATGYHVTSTMHETHPGQTDLQRVGYLFSMMFLPAANVISLGMIVAFSHAGLPGVGEFFTDMWPLYHLTP